jgi:hypothetical protein
MAKVIKYKFLSCEVNHGTEENPDIEQIFHNVTMVWNEANEKIAKRESHNGEYEIYDDGKEEISEPTEAEALDARLTYVEMMTGLLEV